MRERLKRIFPNIFLSDHKRQFVSVPLTCAYLSIMGVARYTHAQMYRAEAWPAQERAIIAKILAQ